MSTASQIPDAFAAGTTVTYTRAYADYPANAGWGATLYLAGASLFSVAGSASGASFVYTLTAAQTALLTAGNYQWREVVSKGTEKYIADSGVVQIEPDITAATAGSMQTFEELELARVEEVLSGRTTGDVESYQVGNRAMTKIPHKELRAYRAELKRTIYAQRHPGTFGPPIRAIFTGVRNET